MSAFERHVRFVPKADIRFWSEMKGTANEGGPLFLKASDDVECLVSAEACRPECQFGEFPALWQDFLLAVCFSTWPFSTARLHQNF
jgi:hypothetical protein